MATRAYSTEAEIAEAVELAHHLERSLLMARIERLTAVLREHGLSVPGTDERLGAADGEHLEACRQVVVAAYALLEQITAFEQALTELRRMVGSGMELVGGEPWRQ